MLSKAAFVLFVAVIAGIAASPAGRAENQKQEEDKQMIIYGPINQNPSVGASNAQIGNKYLHIAQAGEVHLLLPGLNDALEYQTDSLSGVLIPNNDDTNVIMFDPKDPAVSSMVKSMKTFNTLQQNFNRMLRLANPCMIDNEMTPLLRRRAGTFFSRQTKETKWLSEVIEHRLKLIKQHKLLWTLYSNLKSKLEVTFEDIDSVKDNENKLFESEGIFRQKTQDFIAFVLSHIR